MGGCCAKKRRHQLERTVNECTPKVACGVGLCTCYRRQANRGAIRHDTFPPRQRQPDTSTLRVWYSREQYRHKKNGGSRTNRFVRLTVVPRLCEHGDWEEIVPFPSYSSAVPTSAPSTHVIILTVLSAHSEDNASPRNPNVSTVDKSPKSRILEV